MRCWLCPREGKEPWIPLLHPWHSHLLSMEIKLKMLLLHQYKSQMQPQGRLRHPHVMSHGVLCRMGTPQACGEHLPSGAGLLAGSPCPGSFFSGSSQQVSLSRGPDPIAEGSGCSSWHLLHKRLQHCQPRTHPKEGTATDQTRQGHLGAAAKFWH